MKMRCLVILSVVCISALISLAQSPTRRSSPSPSPDVNGWEDSLENVKWQKGPSIGDLGTTAQVHVPGGYVYAGGADTRLIMEASHNPISGNEVGYVAPAGEFWYALFEFQDVGYVRDDEKNKLDADAMLESIKVGTAESNKERVKRGWDPMTIVGWEQPPRYNETTHNLEWAVRAESAGHLVINYNTRLLGRGGVMEVTLVTNPETLATDLPKFKSMLAGFEFNTGQKYAEFRQGDKMAQYGLTGLIVGGSTAVLVKSGAFKWVWKGLVALFILVSGFVKKLFSRKDAD
jgi:uncharacterized membrane-anchored protein